MRKVELIYLHALLAHVHEYLAEREEVPNAFEAYEAVGLGPYQIQRRKGEHEVATRRLATALAEAVTETEADPDVPEP